MRRTQPCLGSKVLKIRIETEVRVLKQQISDAFDDQIKRMKMGELETVQADFDKRAASIQADQTRSDIHTTLLANGIIVVEEM